MKKYAVLLLALFLCACQNVSAGSGVSSSKTSSVGVSSAASAMSLASDTEESKYQDENKTLYETDKYIYIYEKRFASAQDPNEPPQFTATIKRKDKSGDETIVWKKQNFIPYFLTQYGDDIYFGLADFRDFEWSSGGFMHITDKTDKMITEDAKNICAFNNELIFCGKNVPNGEDVKTILQIYSMKEKKFIGVWENITIAYSDSDYEFECVNGILIWATDEGWHHFDYKTGVDTITKEE